jgi:hypothetical protein
VVEVVEAAVVRVWSAADRQRVLARQAAVNCCERPRIFRSPTRVEAEPVEDDGEYVAPDIAEPGERQLHTDDACVEADRRSCFVHHVEGVRVGDEVAETSAPERKRRVHENGVHGMGDACDVTRSR